MNAQQVSFRSTIMVLLSLFVIVMGVAMVVTVGLGAFGVGVAMLGVVILVASIISKIAADRRIGPPTE